MGSRAHLGWTQMVARKDMWLRSGGDALHSLHHLESSNTRNKSRWQRGINPCISVFPVITVYIHDRLSRGLTLLSGGERVVVGLGSHDV